MIKKINLTHSFIFFIIINLFIFLNLIFSNFSITPFRCLLLILLIGVTHGSLDHLKGKKLLSHYNISNTFYFYIAYIFVASLIIILWLIFPAQLLIIFLIVAAYHFGKEDTQFLIPYTSYTNQLLFILKGSLIIFAPLYFNFAETIELFKLLLIENENFYTLLGKLEELKIFLIGVSLSSLASLYLFLKNYEINKVTIFIDYTSILLVNFYFSPLVAFTVYFCFLHSIRHIVNLIFELDKDNFLNGAKLFIIKSIPLTVLTGLLALLSLYFINFKVIFDDAIIKVIFIGLASLTFPHILLEYLLEKNEKQKT
ncbi:Brp/Blh family beta-carotene 15,15'-dioxygenase [Candidatus Pelagibacter sp.]|nr:Brp/Blh family beta-carotene 15,15'-dioxygenase [Candidatus Pelagibacter sp.]